MSLSSGTPPFAPRETSRRGRGLPLLLFRLFHFSLNHLNKLFTGTDCHHTLIDLGLSRGFTALGFYETIIKPRRENRCSYIASNLDGDVEQRQPFSVKVNNVILIRDYYAGGRIEWLRSNRCVNQNAEF